MSRCSAAQPVCPSIGPPITAPLGSGWFGIDARSLNTACAPCGVLTASCNGIGIVPGLAAGVEAFGIVLRCQRGPETEDPGVLPERDHAGVALHGIAMRLCNLDV